MNKKLIIVLLVILTVSLMISTVSASSLDDHKAGTGKMAPPNSTNGMEECKGCHGDLGSTTTSGFCTGCHKFPVFEMAITSSPSATATPVVTAAPAVTTVAAAETPTTPGFGIFAAMVGLFTWALLVKRNNK